MDPVIETAELKKIFQLHEKEPGIKGSIKSLFFRKKTEKTAIGGVNLKIRRGEIVGLVGANGAGKTTLVKCLSGIIFPSSGSAHVLGQVPWERSNAFRRRISLIMGQKNQLWWDLPAADSFLLLKEIYQIPDDIYHSTLEELSERLEVQKLLKTQLRRLSLGERMKMELIAALLHRPEVLFLDEPTIGLDFASQKAVRQFLLEYRKKHDVAILLTSHYMEDIQQLCERIIIIKDGSFVYDGPLKKIQQEFANQKVLSLKFAENPSRWVPSGVEILENTPISMRIRTTREKIAKLAQEVLEHIPVADLNIEEEDIADVISKIMRKGIALDS